MGLLVWYDWSMVANHVMGPVQKTGWIELFLVVITGLYLGGWLSFVPYQVNKAARVTGFPFPVILWEPYIYDSDDWLDFHGIYTVISPVLNACYSSLVLVAVCLTLPHDVINYFYYALLLIVSFKGYLDERKN